MMGRLEPQKDLFTYHINLDKRVRADHPLRQINAVVDWSFIRPLVAPTYGHNGNESVEPVVLVKMMFLLFYDDVKSERELMRIIPERLDYLWFLGYGLDQDIPDHSVLSKARARWGEKVLQNCSCGRWLRPARRDWWMGKNCISIRASSTRRPIRKRPCTARPN